VHLQLCGADSRPFLSGLSLLLACNGLLVREPRLPKRLGWACRGDKQHHSQVLRSVHGCPSAHATPVRFVHACPTLCSCWVLRLTRGAMQRAHQLTLGPVLLAWMLCRRSVARCASLLTRGCYTATWPPATSWCSPWTRCTSRCVPVNARPSCVQAPARGAFLSGLKRQARSPC